MSNVLIDIHCEACHRAGDENPPRFGRFFRHGDGPVKVQHFVVNGEKVHPLPHERPDGGITWQFACPSGHNRPVRHERIVEAFDAMAPGGDRNLRVLL